MKMTNLTPGCNAIAGHSTLADGIYTEADDKTPARRIAGLIEVVALARDPVNNGWSLVLEWPDLEGKPHHLKVRRASLIGNARFEVLAQLADGGLYISHLRADQEILFGYIASVEPKSSALLRSANQVGWLNDAFVLPCKVFSANPAETVEYAGPPSDAFTSSGKLSGWQKNIARLAIGNSRLTFVLSLGFLGPLLEMMNLRNIGFHILSGTSLGKSTAMHVAASIYGPPSQFVAEWGTTLAGLEQTCASRNHGLLCLDEIGQCSDVIIGAAAYLIGNGQGKVRQLKTGSNRPTLTWNLCVLSAGEENLEYKLDKVGVQAKGGQQLRLLSIPGDAGCDLGLFEKLHGFVSAGALSDHLKLASAQYHGSALGVYLEQLTHPDHFGILREVLADMLSSTLTELDVPTNAPADVKRSAKHFAAVAVAGELATALGVTGWTEGAATRAVRQVFHDWLDSRESSATSYDDQVLLRNIRQLLEAHGSSRFSDVSTPSEKLALCRDRLGFTKTLKSGEIHYYVLPEQFDTVFLIGVADKRKAKKLLAERGWLIPEGAGHFTRKCQLPTGSAPSRVYLLTEKCFNDAI